MEGRFDGRLESLLEGMLEGLLESMLELHLARQQRDPMSSTTIMATDMAHTTSSRSTLKWRSEMECDMREIKHYMLTQPCQDCQSCEKECSTKINKSEERVPLIICPTRNKIVSQRHHYCLF